MAKVIVDLGVPGLTITDITWGVCERARDHVAVPTAGSTLTFITGSVGSYWLENPNVTEDTLFYVYRNTTITSPDGIIWTERANPQAVSLNSVCWSGTQFVAVGNADVTDAYILTSPDGIIWTERANPQAVSLNSVCWSGTQFVAVGATDATDAYIITSPDGIIWTERANPETVWLKSVCWGGTQFVAVGRNDLLDAAIITSPDGIIWTERANPKATYLQSICWGGTQFVAVGTIDATDAYIVTSVGFTTITPVTPGIPGLFLSAASLDICNAAILSLGGSVIASFDDATSEGVLCKSLWPAALDSLLRLHPWNCAITRAALLPDAVAPAYEWSAAFTLPTDLLRLLEVENVAEYKVEGRKILCNETALNIRYVFRNNDTSEWDSLLTEAMTAYMAFKLAYALTKSNTTRDAQWQLFTNLLRTAKSIDAQEEPGDTVGDFPFIDIRG